jgi:hypothetical protein
MDAINQQLFAALEPIYITATKLINQKGLSMGEVYDLVKDDLDALEIDFGTAAFLDDKYFGCYGEFWSTAYNHPRVGDLLPEAGRIVKKVGLLTFYAKPDYKYPTYDYYADDYDDSP